MVSRRKGAWPLLWVDACCWIDLLATEHIEEILASLPYRCAVPEYVAEHEVLTVLSRSGTEEKHSLLEWGKEGLVSVTPIQTESEQEAWVRFATYLDDGEAATFALASVHGGSVATNDRKALSVLAPLLEPRNPTYPNSGASLSMGRAHPCNSRPAA